MTKQGADRRTNHRAAAGSFPRFLAAATTAALVGIDEATGRPVERIQVPPDADALRVVAGQTRGRFFAAPTEQPLTSVYENLRVMPRTWLANEVVSVNPDQALDAIKAGRLPDGRGFDPAQTALVEAPIAARRKRP